MSLDIENTSIELTDLIYACLLGEATWQFFLDRLNGMLPGGKSVFLFHDSVRNRGTYSLSSGIGERELADYSQHFCHCNPWLMKLAVWPAGIGVISDQMLDRATLARTEFYNDFLHRIECETAVAVTVARDGGNVFSLSTGTCQADANENVPAARVLTNLVPHFQKAFRLYRNNDLASVSQQMTILDAAGIGLVVVGQSATMKNANPAAMDMVHKGQICFISVTGRFCVKNAEAAAVMQQMLGIGGAVPRHFTYYQPVDDGRAKVTLVRLNKDPVAEFFSGPTVAVLIDVMSLDVDEVAGSLASLYRLTPAEARLAQALDWGATVKEAASAFGISEGTARQQLKAIFRKVGVTRQAELIRAMHDPKFLTSLG